MRNLPRRLSFRQTFATLVLTAGVAFFAAGCGGTGGGTGRPVKLVYWPSANPQEIELARNLVAEWNRAHPNVPVEMQPVPESQSTEEVLLAAIAGRTTPDVCSNIWPGAVAQFVRAGGLIPLDTFTDFDSLVTARLPDGVAEQFRQLDGHVYEVPWKTNPIMVEYNRKVFREAGYQVPPATYKDFLAAGHRIAGDFDGDGQIDRWLMLIDYRVNWRFRLFDFYTYYLAASGGHTLIEDRRVAFENQAAVDVFAFFRRGFELNLLPRSRFQTDPFLLGLVALKMTGPWDIAHVEKFKPAGFDYDIAPVPVPDSSSLPVVTYGDPKNISIFTTTRWPKQAWQFVKFLVSRRADLQLLQICDQIPFRRGLVRDSLYLPYFQENPKMQRFAEQAERTRGVDSLPELKEIFDAISHEFESCCFYGSKTPEEAVRSAAERAREILQ